MKIKYIGHACFLLTTAGGKRILTDPYEPGCFGGALKYRAIEDEADIVLVSHSHADHCYTAGVPGDPQVVDHEGVTSIGNIRLTGIPVWHDTSLGSERGNNIIFRIQADGLTICHLGDLGHCLDEATAGKIIPVDVLLLPVGGHFTACSEDVQDTITALAPKLMIPMHFKTSGVDFPIAPVDDFLEGRDKVIRARSPEAEIKGGEVPEGILVLDPANLP
jgi:L-ascorbate metabolism protein UlaG (beta-lactamase superfamily)